MGIVSFFKKIRNEEDSVRGRWLMILTGASSALVVMIWVFYANSFIPSIAQYDDKYKSEETLAAESQRQFGVLETFSAGVGYVFKDVAKFTNKVASSVGSYASEAGDKLKNGVKEFASVFENFKSSENGKNVIKIDKNSENFVLEGLPPLPKRNLP